MGEAFDMFAPKIGTMDLSREEMFARSADLLSSWLIAFIEQGEKPQLLEVRIRALHILENTGPYDDKLYDEVVEPFATAFRALEQLEKQADVKFAQYVSDVFAAQTGGSQANAQKANVQAHGLGKLGSSLLKAIAVAINKNEYWKEQKRIFGL